jgi:hypothetical protein
MRDGRVLLSSTIAARHAYFCGELRSPAIALSRLQLDGVPGTSSDIPTPPGDCAPQACTASFLCLPRTPSMRHRANDLPRCSARIKG